MKNKLQKNVFRITIFMMILLVILGVCSNVLAFTFTDGKEWHTKKNIQWKAENPHIILKNKEYFCLNHGYNLTKGLEADEPSNIVHVENFEGLVTDGQATFRTCQSGGRYFTSADDYKRVFVTHWYNTQGKEWGMEEGHQYRAITRKEQGIQTIDTKTDSFNLSNPEDVRKLREAAIGGIGKSFYGEEDKEEGFIQYGIWANRGQIGAGSRDAEYTAKYQEIYQAAEYYANDWYNTADEYNHTQLGLQYSDTDAQILFNQRDSTYIAGPFYVSYKTATIGRVTFSEVSDYSVTDQNGNEISGYMLVDKDENAFSGIPNGIPFYVKYPNNPKIKEINVNVQINYLSSCRITEQEYKTYVGEFYYEWPFVEGDNVIKTPVWHHGDNCGWNEEEDDPDDPQYDIHGNFTGYGTKKVWHKSGKEGTMELNQTKCSVDTEGKLDPECGGHQDYEYIYEVKGVLTKDEEFGEQHDIYQDMLEIDGEVRFSTEEFTLTAKRKDEPKDGQYDLVLKKVDTNGNTLPGAVFTVNGKDFTTGVDGRVKIASNVAITKDNYLTNDIYNIQEKSAPTGYMKYDGKIEATIIKTLKTITTETATISQYMLDKVTLDSITSSSGKVRVEEDTNTKTITITVVDEPNIPDKGKYDVVLEKVDNNGKILPGAVFTVNGRDFITGLDGKVKVAENVEINEGNVGNKDTYTIEEKAAPEGYVKYNGRINLEVTKRLYGSNYIVENATLDSASISSGKVKIDNNTNTITITVEDEIMSGQYDVVLKKADTAGKTLQGATFTINGTDYTTDENGEIKVANNVKITSSNVNISDRYEIEEKQAPTGYKKFDGTITLEITKMQNGSEYIVADARLNRSSELLEVSIDRSTNAITITVKDEKEKEPEMEIAGRVWEDTPQGKDSKINGYKDDNDIDLEGIEVRLYRIEKDGTVTLAPVKYSTNPMLTDSEGLYSFNGLDPDYKYYVTFTYDGMTYTNTYGAGIPEYNTTQWSITSKGSEVVSERDTFNKKFVTISSYPASYRTTAIFAGNYLTGGYNKIFAKDDIQTYKDKVTEQIKNYLSTNTRIEDSEYINKIYIPIINSSSDQTEAKQALQYIWDSRINAYAGNESVQDGLLIGAPKDYVRKYPYYDKFVLEDKDGNRLFSDDGPKVNAAGAWYIYNGQLHINLGLIKRPTTDLELQEDLNQLVVSINGKDETYTYGTFSEKGVKLNRADVNFEQKVATADYSYSTSTELGGTAAYPVDYAPIQMYVTYRINVKNNSAVPTSVNEIAAYINSDIYSYSDNYETTTGKKIKGIRGDFVYNDSDTTIATKALEDYYGGNCGLSVNPNSKYGVGSETGKSVGNDLYISFDKEMILEQNQMISLYITYRLGENSTTNPKFNCTHAGDNRAYKVLQDLFTGKEDKKVDIYTEAEINAHSTFFKKVNDPIETQAKYTYPYTSALQSEQNYRAAGLLDANSVPGNLDVNEVENYERKLENYTRSENDWDSASKFVIMDPGETRKLQGNVWETVEDANHYLTNPEPKYDNNSQKVKGITVELIEIKDGQEYVRARTTTDENGAYLFENYIPGQYTVRFIYGDSANYDETQYSNYKNFTLDGKEYKCSYNGEFYQSAKANPNTNNNYYWYTSETGDRYSDAYDEVNIRKAVNESLQNHTYGDVVSLLKNPTKYMVYANTSLLEIEVEKAKTDTKVLFSVDKSSNPSYTIENVDFALTPRTEAKLKIEKEVTHVKLILQNGKVQFDADTDEIRRQGVPAVVQAAQGYDINISMSSELVNGATLEITYKVTLKNDSKEDIATYYKSSDGKPIAVALYKEPVDKLVYYEDDTVRTYDNREFARVEESNTLISYLESGRTEMKSIDTSKTEEVLTTTSAVTVADFISSNLTFAKQDYAGNSINEKWDLWTGSKEEFDREYYEENPDEKGLRPEVTANFENVTSGEVYDNNAIVVANSNSDLVKTLKPGDTVSEDIVLSKVISVSDDDIDPKSYRNQIRILKINNTVSRVQDMASSDLYDQTERVIVSDPTGIGDAYLGIILTLVVAIIIGGGIVLIKKYALNNK